MAKRVCETIVTGLSLACFVVIFILHQCFPVVYKQTSSKEGGVWRKVFTKKIIVTLVTQPLPFSFLSSPVA